MVDINKLNSALLSKGISVKCPICGRNSFTGIDKLAIVPTFEESTGAINMGNTVGFAMMVCNYCNYVMLFNAKALGLP